MSVFTGYEKKFTEAQLAYFAGFLEADGTIIISVSSKIAIAYVSIAQKDPEVLYWIQGVFGGTINKGVPGAWIWSAYRSRGKELLKLTLPFFRNSYSRNRAERYIKFLESKDLLERQILVLEQREATEKHNKELLELRREHWGDATSNSEDKWKKFKRVVQLHTA